MGAEMPTLCILTSRKRVFFSWRKTSDNQPKGFLYISNFEF